MALGKNKTISVPLLGTSDVDVPSAPFENKKKNKLLKFMLVMAFL